MNILIVYDLFFGNTEQIAKSIGSALGMQADVTVARVDDVLPEQVKAAGLLVVGSPTRAFRPSVKTQNFLKSLSPDSLRGIRVAAFDTRINPEDTKSSFLRFMVKLFGYAAKPISDSLVKKGGMAAVPPEGFVVKESEGPLKEGELERASAWGRSLC